MLHFFRITFVVDLERIEHLVKFTALGNTACLAD
ncbi:hypothetical protein NIASO_19865 [Niabella soli DSM 19437]|uniref:Uncharacterized protein n=1 Tax=Niabella soli DSM 19437 TaxID=929713 RepID=W0F4R9_9BACT|nr:hypothetical protein NIASO_19865 [Niabella soli DSM 19437]